MGLIIDLFIGQRLVGLTKERMSAALRMMSHAAVDVSQVITNGWNFPKSAYSGCRLTMVVTEIPPPSIAVRGGGIEESRGPPKEMMDRTPMIIGKT